MSERPGTPERNNELYAIAAKGIADFRKRVAGLDLDAMPARELIAAIEAVRPGIEVDALRAAASEIGSCADERWLRERADRIDGGTDV